MNQALWPSTQLLLTADTLQTSSEILQPSRQLRFLQALGASLGLDEFTSSLVYSTPENNTGWTAFQMGVTGHVSYHHWDQARPNLLQLDLFCLGRIDEASSLAIVRSLWLPTGQRTNVIQREHPEKPLTFVSHSDTVSQRLDVHGGLGPGDHLHLLVDQVVAGGASWDRGSLDNAVAALVNSLGMRCMTSVNSHSSTNGEVSAYDGIVGITTSHVSLRVRQDAENTSVCLDVFSCKEFKSIVALLWLDRLFGEPISRRAVLHDRHPVETWLQIV